MTRLAAVILDDPGVLRDAMLALLAAQADFGPALPADSSEQVAPLMASLQPALILVNLDARTFDAPETARLARTLTSRVGILALAHLPTDTQILLAARAGFEGLVSFREPARAMLDAARRVAAGDQAISPDILSRRERLLGSSVTEPKAGRLSARELEVVRLTASGLTTAEIGRMNNRSHRTIENQLQSAMRKVDARSRVDIVRWAIREGIVQA